MISPLQGLQNVVFKNPVSSVTGSAAAGSVGSAIGGGSESFSDILNQSMQNVSQLESQSDASVNKFLSGENDDPHTMMMAVQRSSLAFDMFVQVRNKVVQAYQEVMKTPE